MCIATRQCNARQWWWLSSAQVSGPKHFSLHRILRLTVIGQFVISSFFLPLDRPDHLIQKLKMLICSESMTEIVGGPDIYVDRLSTLQLTCRCRSGWWWGEAGFRRAGDGDDDDNDDGSDDDDVKVFCTLLFRALSKPPPPPKLRLVMPILEVILFQGDFRGKHTSLHHLAEGGQGR